ALELGADVVVTGRVADASLTLAPAVHEFGWAWDDWDRLAAGTVAGHLIECGAQATGGLWCNWQEAPDLANVGYPIAEMEADGTRGEPATDTDEVSAAYRDGFMASGTLVIFGGDAAAKARRCGEMILARLRRAGVDPEASNVECLGNGDTVPGLPAGWFDP